LAALPEQPVEADQIEQKRQIEKKKQQPARNKRLHKQTATTTQWAASRSRIQVKHACNQIGFQLVCYFAGL